MVDLPGFTKDEVQATLENGYLTISAEKGLDKDEKEKESGRYIRKERYAGACSRSLGGELLTEEDIKAEFKHGRWKLFVPKKEAKPAVEQKRQSPLKDKKKKGGLPPGNVKIPGRQNFYLFQYIPRERIRNTRADIRDFRIRKINCIQ